MFCYITSRLLLFDHGEGLEVRWICYILPTGVIIPPTMQSTNKQSISVTPNTCSSFTCYLLPIKKILSLHRDAMWYKCTISNSHISLFSDEASYTIIQCHIWAVFPTFAANIVMCIAIYKFKYLTDYIIYYSSISKNDCYQWTYIINCTIFGYECLCF